MTIYRAHSNHVLLFLFLLITSLLTACGGGGGGGGGDSETQSIVSNPPAGGGSAPVLDAKNYSATTNAGTAVLLYALDNDVGVFDPSLVVTIKSGPSNGTAVLQPDNSVLYTPNPGFVGTDSFTYTLTVGSQTDSAKVTIKVNNLPVCSYSVGLSWNVGSDPAITGYYIYHGTTSGTYTDKEYVGLVYSHDFCLATNGKHYFAASSVNSSALESDLSSEVSVTIP